MKIVIQPSAMFSIKTTQDPQLKKKQENYRAYFKKHRKDYILSVGEKKFSWHEYDVKPVADYYDLEKKIARKKLIRLADDYNFYEKIIAENLYNYVNSNTIQILAKEISIHTVFPDDNPGLFFFWLQAKIIKSEYYSIPLLLEYQYEKYKNKTKRKNSRENKNEFMHQVEFLVLKNLHNWSPFDYEKQGEEIVKWLREKRYKLKVSYLDPAMEEETTKKKEKLIESIGGIDALIRVKKLKDFNQVENDLISEKYLKSDGGMKVWIKSKTDFVIWILGLNEKKYFLKDILLPENNSFRKNVKTVFEKHYSVKFIEEFQPARIRTINLKLDKHKLPYSIVK